MSLVSLQRVSKSVSGRPLFDEISFVIEERERLALIGANGTGKSTLLKMVTGIIEPEDGTITRRRGLSITYVPQQEIFTPGATVRTALEDVCRGVDHIDAEAQIARTLGITGFTGPDRPVESLSGGWKKRLSIARGLVLQPELLLLDEPTNHLDIDGIEWLEELVSGLPCSVVFISHDRYFIEAVGTKVIELDRRYPGGFLSIEGNYSEFIFRRAEYYEQRQQYQETLANKVRREVEWLRQGAKARTTKSKHRSDKAQKMVSELSSIDLTTRKPKLQFLSGGRKTKELLKAEELSVAIGDRTLANNLSFVLYPGSCFGIVGPNGSGKSTLIKTLLGELKPHAGRLLRASNLKVAVFDQSRSSLNLNETLKEALIGEGQSFVWNGVEYTAIAWGKRFLFKPEQMSLPVRSLSGGEQARVLISRLMRTAADILILDEPTNDLDIQTLEVLEESIDEFPGAIVLVTHDRYLLDRASTSVIGLDGDGKSDIFASYLQWEIAREAAAEASGGKQAPKTSGSKENAPARIRAGLTFTERHELQGIHKKIEKAEARFKEIELKLHDPANSVNHAMLTELCDDLAHAQAEVDSLYARWGELEQKKENDPS